MLRTPARFAGRTRWRGQRSVSGSAGQRPAQSASLAALGPSTHRPPLPSAVPFVVCARLSSCKGFLWGSSGAWGTFWGLSLGFGIVASGRIARIGRLFVAGERGVYSQLKALFCSMLEIRLNLRANNRVNEILYLNVLCAMCSALLLFRFMYSLIGKMVAAAHRGHLRLLWPVNRWTWQDKPDEQIKLKVAGMKSINPTFTRNELASLWNGKVPVIYDAAFFLAQSTKEMGKIHMEC